MRTEDNPLHFLEKFLMKRIGLLIACFLLVVFLVSSLPCLGFRHLKEGESPPGFKLKDLEGKTHSLSQLKGKVTIVLYGRVGQERSLGAVKELKIIYENLSDQPLQILIITKDTDKNELTKIKGLKKSLGIPFPILLDSEEKVYAEFGVFVFPSTALIDKNGVYRSHYGGFPEDYYDVILGRTRVLLGIITEEELKAERERKIPTMTESQKRALNRINLGKTLLDRGMEEKAMQEFRKAVELDPDNPEGQILLGLSLVNQKEIEQALKHLEKGIELDPRSIDAKIGLGRAYRMKGQTDKALEILQTGLALIPNSAIIHLELGEIYEFLGKTDDALKHYKASAKCSLKKKRNH